MFSSAFFQTRRLSLALLLTLLAGFHAVAAPPEPAKPQQPKVQIAFLLDTSSSMNGLINQTRTHLWDIVNTIATGKRNGHVPQIEVALYEYGNNSLSRDSGYIRQVVPLSQDLDRLSEALFALSTNGGDEYCGQVMETAAQLAWSPDAGVYKAIFIAGNESFAQGAVNYEPIATGLKERGITVNTIYCGGYQDGINLKWLAGAVAGGGQYSVIEQNKRATQVAAPQDVALLKLNQELNRTYVALGEPAKKAKERQQTQDDLAGSMGTTAKVDRTIAKSQVANKPASWDVVGRMVEGDAAPMEEAIAAEVEELPDAERAEEAKKLREEVAAQVNERRRIKDEIAKLSAERREFLDKQKKEENGTIDEAVRRMIQTQMKKTGFQFQ